MALKRYRIGEHFFQYEEGKQPEGAVLADVQEKAAEPRNKARRPANKRIAPKKKE